MLALLHRAVLAIAYHVSKLCGAVHFPYTHKLIKARQYREVTQVIKPGIVLLTRMHGELSNVFIQGTFTHAAIFGGMEAGERFVIEAIGSGVNQTDLIDFMLSKDEVVVVMPLFATEDQMKTVASLSLSQSGKPYNYDFEEKTGTPSAFYCSELVWWCYKQVLGDSMPLDMRERLGVLTVTPDDIWLAKSKFKMIWTSLT